jgi:hypothetical protein
MDRTAIAAIIIGFGATIAAMVFPTKYPDAPKWAVNLSWWGGLFFIVAGIAYQITEHPLSDLKEASIAAVTWFFNQLVALQRLSGFWIAVAFVCGIAAHRWLLPLLKTKLANRTAGPHVEEWLTPHQAIEKFINPEMLSQSRRAAARARELRDNVKLLETKLQNAKETEKAKLRVQLDALLEECISMEYLAAHRRSDVMNDLYQQLRSRGRLVAKGYEVKGGKVKKRETYIPEHYWGIVYPDNSNLNIETGTYSNMLGAYQNVLIGKKNATPKG